MSTALFELMQNILNCLLWYFQFPWYTVALYPLACVVNPHYIAMSHVTRSLTRLKHVLLELCELSRMPHSTQASSNRHCLTWSLKLKPLLDLLELDSRSTWAIIIMFNNIYNILWRGDVVWIHQASQWIFVPVGVAWPRTWNVERGVRKGKQGTRQGY